MKKDKKPLVSIIMPAYNGNAFIAEAVESIVSQSYRNFELILIDDASTDNTPRIIRDYQLLYPSVIRGIFLKESKGESASANIGFKAARGDFIARMDADDVSHPDRLRRQVDFMLKNPEVIVLGTQGLVINENGVVIGKKIFPTQHEDIYKTYGFLHPMLHPSCMIRRSLLPNNHLYENRAEPNDDYFTLFNLLNYGKFANLNEFLVSYRIHKGNKSLQKPKSKFLNILRIRYRATRDFGYRITATALFINLLQLLVVGLLPERLVVPTYMFLRGMASPFRKIYQKAALKEPAPALLDN